MSDPVKRKERNDFFDRLAAKPLVDLRQIFGSKKTPATDGYAPVYGSAIYPTPPSYVGGNSQSPGHLSGCAARPGGYAHPG